MFPTPHSTCSCASNSVIRQEELAVLTGSGNRLPRNDGGSEERRATPYPSQRGRAKGHSVPSFPLGCAGQWSRITFHLLLYQPIGYPSGKYNKGGIKHTWACSLLLQGIVTPSLRRQRPPFIISWCAARPALPRTSSCFQQDFSALLTCGVAAFRLHCLFSLRLIFISWAKISGK